MGKSMLGEAMPKTLAEALALDASIAKNWTANLEKTYLLNWQAIQDGKFPISSNRDCLLLLDKLLAEREHSDGDFVKKIARQIHGFLSVATATQMLEASE
ncbi:hypothetical protein [Rhizobium rhizogenes]|uniref:hypothetical protein n=1 Tax=Rhizobium rhizogenes TaxID=359 RepID=UPI00157224E6|nr:hypothetical protein [Rhizobium rhizogenes]NTF80875.1 hypothetical protein [Rhizobium rhizogenes]